MVAGELSEFAVIEELWTRGIGQLYSRGKLASDRSSLVYFCEMRAFLGKRDAARKRNNADEQQAIEMFTRVCSVRLNGEV